MSCLRGLKDKYEYVSLNLDLLDFINIFNRKLHNTNHTALTSPARRRK